MAEIEDFVVESIMNDMNQQLTQAPGQPQPVGVSAASRGMRPTGMTYGQLPRGSYGSVNPETGMKWGDYAIQAENQRVAALQRRDAARSTIMQAMKGLDPKIQGTILQRLGIDPGIVKSELEQQQEMLRFKQQLGAPQQETENTLKMMGIQRQLGQGEQELGLKERQFQAETAGRGETRNIQLMRVLAMMMQSNPQLQGTIGPMLLQLMQASGINLAPPKPGAPSGGHAAYQPRPGVTITQEE